MVWCNQGLNPGLPDHWRTLYPLGQLAGYVVACIFTYVDIFLLSVDGKGWDEGIKCEKRSVDEGGKEEWIVAIRMISLFLFSNFMVVITKLEKKRNLLYQFFLCVCVFWGGGIVNFHSVWWMQKPMVTALSLILSTI